MFSRLNEAVPLNAPEKRNAFAGPLPPVIRSVAGHKFFGKKIPFPNSRYRYYDLAAKFLLLERHESLVDTKKVYLDRFVKQWSNVPKLEELQKQTREILNAMDRVFTEKDHLLRSVGSVVLYYFLFRTALQEDWINDITRSALDDFERQRIKNRQIAQNDFSAADYDLLEFDRFIQAPNDAYALKIRFSILMNKIFDRPWNVIAGN